MPFLPLSNAVRWPSGLSIGPRNDTPLAPPPLYASQFTRLSSASATLSATLSLLPCPFPSFAGAYHTRSRQTAGIRQILRVLRGSVVRFVAQGVNGCLCGYHVIVHGLGRRGSARCWISPPNRLVAPHNLLARTIHGWHALSPQPHGTL